MNLWISLIVVLILTLSALGIAFSPPIHSADGDPPLCAFAVFIAGFIYRIVKWAKAPVPFRITTTCGQQTSLPWIKSESAGEPLRPLGRDRADGPGGLPVPVALPEHRRGDRGAAARLRQRQMALVLRPSLPLVAADHRRFGTCVSSSNRSPPGSAASRPSTASSRSASRPSI